MTPESPVFTEIGMRETAKADPNIHVNFVDHPVIDHFLRIIRDEKTERYDFRDAIEQLAPFLVIEASKKLSTHPVEIDTPNCHMVANELDSHIVILPILRAGDGMRHTAEDVFPRHTVDSVIFAGVKRLEDEGAVPNWYRALDQVQRLNGGEKTYFVIVDPMLATGGSADEVIKEIKKRYPKGTIVFCSMIASKDGIQLINKNHPDVEIFVAAVDDHLNEHAYIVPGLGDAGDRQFGT